MLTASSQTYALTVTDNSNNCNGSGSITVSSVVADPTINVQPTVSQDVCVGGSSPVTVGATGGTGTFSYQWFSNTVNNNTTGTSLGALNGAQTVTYTPPNAGTGSTYYYCVVSQDGAGCGPVTSNTALVTVIADPTIGTQPLTTQTVCQNAASTNLTVTTNGGTGSTSFQWFSNSANSMLGAQLVAGNGAQTITYTPPTNVVGTLYYYCVVTRGGSGCGSVSSNTAQVTVNPTPSISNQSLTVCSGTPFSITPSGSATYSWAAPSGSGFSGGASGSGAASITGTLTATSVATATYTVTPTTGSCSGATFTLTVTVNPLPIPVITISNDNSGTVNDGIVCANTPITLTATGGTSYSWTIPGGSSSSNQIIITNATYPTHHGGYTVTVTSANSCTASTTQSVVVNPLPTGGTISPISFCPLGSALMTITGVSNATQYSWSLPAQLSGSSTTNAITISGSTSGTYTVTVTPINFPNTSSCPGTPVTGTVTVKAIPTVTTVNNNPTICSGANADITLSPLPANVGGTLFDWSRDNTINVTGDFSENNVSGPIIEALTNTTNTPQTVVFTITPKADGCPGTPVQVSVVVNPTPNVTITNNSPNICTGGTTSITLNSNVSGATFNWTRSNPTITGTDFQNGITGPIAVTLTNGTVSDLTTVFTVTPIANGCTGSSQNTSVGVGALPTTGHTLTASPTTVCEGQTATVTVNTSQANVVYQLRRADNSLVSGAFVSGAGSGPKVINVPASALTVAGSPHTFNVLATTPAPYGCSAQLVNTVTITVHQPSTAPTTATADGQSSLTICPGFSGNITFAASGGFLGSGSVVNWYSGGCASGPILATGASVVLAAPVATTTYYVNYSGSECTPTGCATVTVIVEDITPPTITCPAPISVNTSPGLCSAVVTYSVTASDNCPSYNLVQNTPFASGASFPLGITTNTFTVTDASGNSVACSFTVTVTDNQAPVPAANGSSTVACPDYAIPPTVPTALDNCNGTINGVYVSTVNTPMFLTCEGTRVYTYSYTDASNNVSYWTYTYTIERLPFTISTPNGAVDVTCPDDTDFPPTAYLPVEVKDNCDNTLTPVLHNVTAKPTCFGDRTYTYRYTDCEGNFQDWSFTYYVQYDVSFTGPADGGAIVSCPNATDTPPTLPIVTDNCDVVLIPDLQNVTAKPTCEGTRTYTYLYEDCVGNQAEWNFTYTVEYDDFTLPAPGGSIVACPNATDFAPTLPVFTDNCGVVLTPSPSVPVISSKPVCEGTRTYTYTLTDCEGNNHNWVYTYTVERLDFTPPAPGGSTIACASLATPPTLPTVTDNCGTTLTPSAPAMSGTYSGCEGTIIYTYTYTDCEGNTNNWVYTYTIERLDFTMSGNGSSTVACASAATPPTVPAVTDHCNNPITPTGPFMSGTYSGCEGTIIYTYTFTDCELNTHNWTYTYTVEVLDFTVPANGSSTVTCIAAAVAPTLPTVTSNCGITLTPSAPAMSGTYDGCEGTRIYTYTYTDCEGNIQPWSYTYTIDYSGVLTAPTSTASTVSCPAAAVNPGAPANITDACGSTVSPVLIGSTQTPDPVTCEGTVVWTYRYTACDGSTFADWTHTYTINYSGGLTPPASTTATVSCPVAAVNPGAPANITDACGRTVSPVLIGSTQTPDPVTCEGTVVWTYRYTACDGTTTADWTHTYTINYSGGLTAPTSTTATVSCPANATNPGAPANITDACGRTVSPVLIGSTQTPDPVTCEGTIVWTYRYTACDGTTTADWTHTYTINYSGGLTAPTSTTATVSCPAAAVNPGAPANITDACGRTVSPVLIGSTQTPDPVTCEGTVVWTYRYTACDGTTTADWTHTYTINYSGGLTAPTSTTATVSCPANATNPGAPANITDACGRTVSPVLIGSTQTPDPVTCEGTVVWTYRYTACDGTTTADWTHTYTIDYSGGLTPPVSTTATVNCPANATNPGAPANITDACGRTVSPVLIGSTQTPDPVTCEGTVVWTYRYTACDNTTIANWTHTYTIERQDFSMPSDDGTTVACIALALAPSPPAVNDNCNNPITPTGPAQGGTYDGCEGTRTYTYTYTDCELNTHNWVYTYTIERVPFTVPGGGSSTVDCASDATAPVLPNVTDNCGNTLNPTGPVMGGTYNGCQGTIIYTYTYTDCELNSQNWAYTYTIVPQDFTVPANGSKTVACEAEAIAPPTPDVDSDCGIALTPTGPVMGGDFNGCEGTIIYNYTYTDCAGFSHIWSYIYTVEVLDFDMPDDEGSIVACPDNTDTPPTLPVVEDYCGNTLTPSAPVISTKPVCEGDRTYTYTYTDCEGTSHNWVYTYTVERLDFTIIPATAGSTVSCPDATDTAPTLPVVTDNCGNVLTASAPVISTKPLCEGTRTYTYTYTDCELNTHNWVYTYTVDYSGGLTPPASTTSTISCPANATNPGAPADITDACGRTVSAVLVGSSAPVSCEGTLVWTYRYTACDNTTFADWTHTYTIDYSGGLAAVPASTTSTVSCPANATNPGAPADILDACNRTVSPVLIGSTQTPNPVLCEGTIVWTYRYTACDNTTFADWTHTYTIDYSGGLAAVPASTTATVSCPANATNPGAPANILDACGRTVSPVLIGSTQTPDPVTCEGTVVWTYRYTACDGTFADWTHTYTINYSGGLTPPASTTATVSCPANAANPGAPANITDACGRTVSPVLIGSTQTPDPVTCEGTVVWTYRYTACDGTTADWTHTYTINYSGGLTPPTSTTATVSCPANATNPGAPANITDACGRTVSPVLIGSTQTPDPVTCEGTVVWTYRYTACDGTTTADWTHTYTIDYSGGLTAPTSTTSTVSCPAAAVNPGAPADITDACGRTVSAVLVGSSAPVTCEGTIGMDVPLHSLRWHDYRRLDTYLHDRLQWRFGGSTCKYDLYGQLPCQCYKSRRTCRYFGCLRTHG